MKRPDVKKTKMIHVRLTADQHEALRKRAEWIGTDMGTVARLALLDYIRKQSGAESLSEADLSKLAEKLAGRIKIEK